jgi:hypothetical protein
MYQHGVASSPGKQTPSEQGELGRMPHIIGLQRDEEKVRENEKMITTQSSWLPYLCLSVPSLCNKWRPRKIPRGTKSMRSARGKSGIVLAMTMILKWRDMIDC